MENTENQNLGGRPPLFATQKELEAKIDQYFTDGVQTRKVLIGKAPNQTIEEIPVPTITGLCYYLGFESRQSFYDYEEKPMFSYTVKKARLFIEMSYEQLLVTGNPTGAIFALKNLGWKDEKTVDNKGSQTITIERKIISKDESKS